jgi:hypothetical protein
MGILGTFERTNFGVRRPDAALVGAEFQRHTIESGVSDRGTGQGYSSDSAGATRDHLPWKMSANAISIVAQVVSVIVFSKGANRGPTNQA